jgi:hypothetical protein
MAMRNAMGETMQKRKETAIWKCQPLGTAAWAGPFTRLPDEVLQFSNR